jgi:histone-binding protein RBBP4
LAIPSFPQVVDFQWNPHDPWTMLSVSDDAADGGGGTLQLWRISDLIYRPDEELMKELAPYRCAAPRAR